MSTAQSTEVSRDIEEAMHCTNRDCSGVFVSLYRYNTGQGHYDYYRSIPSVPVVPVVSDELKALSPTFFETYTQAMVSEGLGLTQLTGIGLRKALEFLVKDFAINEKPAEKEAILKKTLAACINDYMSDASLKETAKRAAWLGNDETHYLRKWESRDVGDLKVLIRLTMNGVENVVLSRKYITEMPAT